VVLVSARFRAAVHALIGVCLPVAADAGRAPCKAMAFWQVAGPPPPKDADRAHGRVTSKRRRSSMRPSRICRDRENSWRPWKVSRLGGRFPLASLGPALPHRKTLIARAVAGDPVPFFTISGSDFVGLFVGVGASRCPATFRTGQEECSLHHLHRRNRRGRRHRGAGLCGGQ